MSANEVQSSQLFHVNDAEKMVTRAKEVDGLFGNFLVTIGPEGIVEGRPGGTTVSFGGPAKEVHAVLTAALAALEVAIVEAGGVDALIAIVKAETAKLEVAT